MSQLLIELHRANTMWAIMPLNGNNNRESRSCKEKGKKQSSNTFYFAKSQQLNTWS